MGDRGGVLIRTEDDFVFLYTHWYGSSLISDVKNGLKNLFDNEDRPKFDNGSCQAAYIAKEMLNYGGGSTSVRISGIGYESIGVMEFNGKTLKKTYEKIKAGDFFDADVLIIIEREKLMIKEYDPNFLDPKKEKYFLEPTNLKDFMLTD